jgi:hypothetical protein
VDERHHASPAHEVRVGNSEGEAGPLHIARERLRGIRLEREGDVDVGAEARHAVEHDSLRPEQVPPAPPFEDWHQRRQQVNGGWPNRHGG